MYNKRGEVEIADYVKLIHFWLHHTARCALACGFCISRKMGQEEVGGVIAGCCADSRLGCKEAMFGTGLANSSPGYMNRLRKHYSLTL